MSIFWGTLATLTMTCFGHRYYNYSLFFNDGIKTFDVKYLYDCLSKINTLFSSVHVSTNDLGDEIEEDEEEEEEEEEEEAELDDYTFMS